MPVWQLDERLIFPDPSMADPDGLLAIGGDLSADRLMLAYSSGIFPWFTHDDEPFWFSPDPRCVLEFQNLHITKSMQQLLKQHAFRVTIDHAFPAVIAACAAIPRKEDAHTWIDRHFIRAYRELHDRGIAHSVEVWDDDQLAGGLYGLSLGACFFGESMFSKKSNASKYGFIRLMQYLAALEYAFVDCQVYNPHLASLGAHNVLRESYLHMLKLGLQKQPKQQLSRQTLDQGASRRMTH